MKNESKFHIAGVGCCLVDQLFNNISFTHPNLKKYLSRNKGDGGLKPGELVFADDFETFAGEHFADLLTKITNGRQADSINIGGPAIVALIHAAQMLEDEAFTISFHGMYGSDEIGEYLYRSLENTPVEISNIQKSEGTTPSTVVLSDPDYANGEGERMFINAIAAAWNMSPQNLRNDFFNSRMVVFGGTALTPNIHDHLSILLRSAKERNIFTVVNTVFDFRNEQLNPFERWPMGDNDDSYRNIDLLIMDHLEALRYSGKENTDEAILFFKNSGVQSIIITNGAKEVCFYADGVNFKQQYVDYMPVSSEVSTRLKTLNTGDTTGCGDNFVGGIIASVAKQIKQGEKYIDIREAVTWGIVSGGFACFYLGGTYMEKFSGEKRQKIERLYNKYEAQVNPKR